MSMSNINRALFPICFYVKFMEKHSEITYNENNYPLKGRYISVKLQLNNCTYGQDNMKSILVICNRSHIDNPLRKSMAHLAKSCQIEIASDGIQAFDTLTTKTFDLIVVDFEITGIDGLEMVESIGYIDPGVPVILMLKQKHKVLWDQACCLNAHPIYHPFKPLTFLRLVDTLLHQHLERYRNLSKQLHTALETLTRHPNTKCAFITEADGQILMSAGSVKETRLEALGKALVDKLNPDRNHFEVAPPVQISDPFEKEYNLYATCITEGLNLGVVATPKATTVWINIDVAVQSIQHSLCKNTPLEYNELTVPSPPNKTPRVTISLEPSVKSMPLPLPNPVQSDTDDVIVNWQILSNNSVVLNRLQDILSN